MVELGRRALGLVVDAALVGLERRVAGIDGDRDGADRGRGGLEGRLAALLDVLVRRDGGALVGGVVAAGAVLGRVRVRGLGIDALVGDDVLEAV